MEKISQIFKVKELRNKILVVLGMLVVFRVLAAIPVPGIDIEKVRQFFAGNQFLGMLNIFSGSGMSSFSLVMLGVGPYITSSIVMQLMTMVVPAVEKMYKEEGEAGRQKFNQITRYLTLPFALLQAVAMVTLLRNQQIIGDLGWWRYATVILTVVAGTMFLMWLGELITKKGIGNGTSLLIFAGIVASLPSSVKQLALAWDESQLLVYVAMAVAFIAVIYGVVFVTEGQRNVPVTYARRMTGGRNTGGGATYLPLRVNQAGVIPIIFAMSILLFPNMVANLLMNSPIEQLKQGALVMNTFFSNSWVHGILYFILVVAFTFFYTKIAFEPKSVAENLQKNGGYIPGIRPGKKTEEHLDMVVNRVTLFGAIFLATVAVLPFVVQGMTGITTLSIGGTSLLIVISVVIETLKQIDSQLVMQRYEKL